MFLHTPTIDKNGGDVFNDVPGELISIFLYSVGKTYAFPFQNYTRKIWYRDSDQKYKATMGQYSVTLFYQFWPEMSAQILTPLLYVTTRLVWNEQFLMPWPFSPRNN